MSQMSLHFYQCKQCRASSARTFETDFKTQLSIGCQQNVVYNQVYNLMDHPVFITLNT